MLMFSIRKISVVFISLAVLIVPSLAAHAQVMGPNGYQDYYSSTAPDYNYEQTYYPSEYQQQYSNGYYPQQYSYQLPTCTISITTPNTYDGSQVQGTLSWTSYGAYSGYISSLGEVNTEGSAYVTAYPYETFTMSVSGPGGTNTCQTEYYPAQYPTYYQQPVTYYPQPQSYYEPAAVYPAYNYTAPPTYTYWTKPITYIRHWWDSIHW